MSLQRLFQPAVWAILLVFALLALTPAVSAQIDPEAAARGQLLFQINGCIACHGPDGSGTAIAPSVGGHTPNQIRRQVRAPLNIMPVFPPSQIPNSDLVNIVEYIKTLPLLPDHIHYFDDDFHNPRNEVMLRYWLGFFYLVDGNVSEARFQLDILNQIVIATHNARLQQLLAAVDAGNMDEVTTIMHNVVAGQSLPDSDIYRMHLEVAFLDLQNRDAGLASHDLNRVLDNLPATDRDHIIAQLVMPYVNQNDWDGGMALLNDLLKGNAEDLIASYQ